MTIPHRLHEHAAELRSRAGRVAALGGTLRWRSPAASVLRGELDRLARELRVSADRMDRAADSLARHRARISRLLP